MLLRKNLTLLVILFTSLFSQASFAIEFAEFGLVNLHLPLVASSSNPTYSGSGGFSFGAGLTLGVDVARDWLVEVGFIYLVRNFSTQSATQPITGNGMSMLQAPILARYWVTPHLSVGLGGYFGQYMGSLAQTQGATTVSTNWPYLLYEYGVVSSLRLKSPISDLMSAILDVRFLYALSNADGSNQITQLTREFQFLGGIAFIL